MSAKPRSNFLREIQRRGVVRTALAYLISAWLLIQVADTVFPYIGLSESTITFIIGVLAVGFVPALILAWIFEWTPQGLKKDHQVARDDAAQKKIGRRVDYIIIGMLTIAVAVFSYDKFVSPIVGSPVQVIANVNPAIAVLPFENRSANEDDVFFVDGVHDDILTSLAKIASLKVISRTSVEQYKNTTKTIREIGAELGVTAILEGGIQRVGNRVRVIVQLIDVATDTHQWAEVYERELSATNIFSIQSEISNTIAVALQTTLSPAEQFRIADVPTESLEAYEAYLLGNQRLKRRRGAAIEEAVSYFQEAVELDPGFALAYVGLADSYQLLRSYTNRQWDELRPLATAAAERAIELDPNLGESYASLATIHSESREFALAGPLFDKALQLSPNYATGHQWYAEFLSRTGNPQAALEQIQIAAQIDPLSPIINHIFAGRLRNLGRYAEAEEKWRKAIEVDADFARAYQGLAALYFSNLGRLDDAAIMAYKASLLNPDVSTNFALLANILISLGDDIAAERWLSEGMRLDPDNRSVLQVMSTLSLFRSDWARVAEIARKMLRDNPRNGWHVAGLSDYYQRSGRVADALSVFEAGYPELMTEMDPGVRQNNASMAIILARLHQEAGNIETAQQLLERSLEVYNTSRNEGVTIGLLPDVRIYALMGEKEKALDALRTAIDSGWRFLSFYIFDSATSLDSIRNEPEFIAMAEEVDADLARQRESLKKKWASEFGQTMSP